MSPRRRPSPRGAWRGLAGMLPLLGLAACGSSTDTPPPGDSASSEAAAPWFEEVAASSGLTFTHQSGHRDAFWMPEIMAGGAAWLDFDDDGDLDAYLVQGGRYGSPDPAVANQLFENLGQGRFAAVAGASSADGAAHRNDLADSGYGMGVAVGDADGDGRVDLYVTNVGRNTLLLNRGEGRFVDVTEEAGVGDTGWGSSAAFLDFDRDGDLDLMVANYLRWSPETEVQCHSDRGEADYCSPQSYNAPAPDVLYENLGDGTFRDVSKASGIGRVAATGLGVAINDFDGDGWLDIFVANDGMPDHLWINLQDGRFEERAMALGCALDRSGIPKAGMGVTVADLDADGDPDLLVGNLNTESDSLFLNRAGYFTESTARLGLAATSRPFTRFGKAWTDFDNDGLFDLYQANGRVTQHGEPFSADPFAEPNLLYRGLPGPKFQEMAPRGGTEPPLYASSRAAAFGDFDNDGGIDILVVNRDSTAHLLHNRLASRGHWLILDVREASGAPALGAMLHVDLTVGRRIFTVQNAYSYQAANDPRVHIGLGEMDRLPSVQVVWVDGERTELTDLAADRVHRLDRRD